MFSTNPLYILEFLTKTCVLKQPFTLQKSSLADFCGSVKPILQRTSPISRFPLCALLTTCTFWNIQQKPVCYKQPFTLQKASRADFCSSLTPMLQKTSPISLNSRRRSKVPLRTPLVFSTNPLYNFEFPTKPCVLQAAIYLAKSFVGRLLRLPDADVAKDVPDFPAQEEEVEGSPENSPGVLYQPLVHLLSPLQLLKLLHKRVVT